ncbi:unnamed protein product [Somion occarium]|uniref:DNA (cytosine-5-)-methyltransferase n=1 Tax=Somion occarium TaxID=3059160 RepID=A0ABP1CGQ1_9APHY
MSRPRRPTAFDISFPTEDVVPGTTSLNDRAREAARLDYDASRRRPLPQPRPNASGSGSGSARLSSSSTTTVSGARTSLGPDGVQLKRKSEGDAGMQNEKRPRVVQPKARYLERDDEDEERADLIIIGEDTEAVPEESNNKPIRLLSDFVIYDPKHGNELISLLDLENGDVDREFQAAGLVAPVFVNEEDAGQEDDEDVPVQRLRTSAIFRFSLDYTQFDEPVYIETQYAWYILKNPGREYKSVWTDFYRPRRIAQIVVSSACENPDWDYHKFCEKSLGAYDELLGDVPQKKDVTALIESEDFSLRGVIDSLDPERPEIYRVPMIRSLFRNVDTPPSSPSRPIQRRPNTSRAPPPRHPLRAIRGVGNIDIAVLRPENQERTHVTPLIDELASHPVRFRERLQVIGPAPKPIPAHRKLELEKQLHNRVIQLWKEDKVDKKIHFPPNARLTDEYWRRITVNGEVYAIGDCIFVRAGVVLNRPAPEWPSDISQIHKTHTVADFFWLAKIISINKWDKQIHVQYFEHSSKTLLQEISDPQELFLTNTCANLEIPNILGKAVVHTNYIKSRSSQEIHRLHFFCNLVYNDQDGSFTSLSSFTTVDLSSMDPPDNCPNCALHQQHLSERHPEVISDGLTFQGNHYHLHDYILIKSEPTPCVEGGHLPDVQCDTCRMKATPAVVGLITDIKWAKSTRRLNDHFVTVRVLGRIADITGVMGCPKDIIRDEHLFFTDLEMDVPMDSIVKQCRVLHVNSYSKSALTAFLGLSPYHFYVQYSFPHLNIQKWRDGRKLEVDEVLICPICYAQDQKWERDMQEFMAAQRRRPLRALDIFAGVGAFSFAMEAIAGVKTTHAVEISPSAAKTLQKNSPDTVVYNQCANKVLQYAYKSFKKQEVEPPRTKGDEKPLPAPPKPGDIDCIIAGFPCQPHSALNMYQKANDKKSHLILNLLSWVDFMKPKYCYFENVRGFLKYKLNAVQETRYKVAGGIELGGLKFVVRAMLAMGYQIRIALLQAAHYSTPQSRVRFFLVAAQNHLQLPAFPTPTHEFPLHDALEIKPPDILPLRPMITVDGSAPYKYVTVQDAIEDLPIFDWKHAEVDGPWRVIQHPETGLELTVPAHDCNPERSKCGISGKDFRYTFKRPQTSFQEKCRAQATDDIQHFTRVLKSEVVRRVVKIPLQAKADYRKLPQSDWEWQFANPSSAVARDGFRPGLYGRLDKNAWFHTTVTNVEPTAKQSWVLHPWCKRVVTVRELARSQGFPDSFVFHSENNDIKTMHRQIGNAVPWPVAEALGRELRDAMFKDWLESRDNAIVIE